MTSATPSPFEVGPIRKKRHSLLWRAILSVDALSVSLSPCSGAERLARYNAALEIDCPHDLHGEDVILVAGDEAYFQRYGASFIRSLALLRQSFFVHLHLFQPGPEVLAEVARLRRDYPDIALSLTIDRLTGLDLPRRLNIYYNAARFIAASELLDRGVARLLILDIDTLARRSPWERLAGLTCDVAFNFRPDKTKPWQKILANAVYYQGTPAARAFSQRFARALLKGLARNPAYHLDQIVPHYLLKSGRRFARDSVGALPDDLISLDYDPQASLWTAKGAHKRSERFLLEKARVDQMARPQTGLKRGA
ncbi:hypothetical protein BJF92_00225 [Rhizobium rhizosphaerae]|uniref:Uncharacterized protein n=1 Tax=Xaviernesmea rhizosphaerae TaxID=1672749 RepID=A0A1Q9AE56_9HYPH|nr:hypothetical protein [Xaviernesmea rhizosphaerae]OLP53237.1 hypothetical protein BJF92_00225 [Xaviernesmea rhizosphaerae]